jgi:hypothetical protein
MVSERVSVESVYAAALNEFEFAGGKPDDRDVIGVSRGEGGEVRSRVIGGIVPLGAELYRIDTGIGKRADPGTAVSSLDLRAVIAIPGIQ